MTETAARPILRAGTAEVLVDPAAGGRIVAVREAGVDLVKPAGTSVVDYGLYPMVPWAGRLRDGVLAWRGGRHRLPTHLTPPHAIHGTLLEAPWSVVEASTDGVTLTAALGAPWPFGGRATQRIALEPGAVRLELVVEADAAEFPAIVGWHPWFLRQLHTPTGAPLGGPAELDFAPGGMLVRGADYLPTGEVRPSSPGPWDDCFVDVARPPVVRWPGAFEVTIESDAPDWVCYTLPPEALCVEPQTGPPNGLNTDDHAVVGPGRPLVASMSLRWRSLG